MSNYYPTGVRSPLMRIRGMAGLGDSFPGLTCARTAPQADNPAVTECIDANGNVLGTAPTAQVAAASSNTIFGYDSTTVIAVGAMVALFLLLKKGK